jgi:hypothetical protein
LRFFQNDLNELYPKLTSLILENKKQNAGKSDSALTSKLPIMLGIPETGQLGGKGKRHESRGHADKEVRCRFAPVEADIS